MTQRILILGGDGYLGWPTAMALSRAGHDVHLVDNFAKRQWELEIGRPSPLPDPDAPRADPRLARGDRARHRALRRRPDRLRLRRIGDPRRPARHDRPLRRTAVGAVLDDRRAARDVHPGEQRHRQPQRPVRDPRRQPRDAPGQARHDGRVRDARHRHRRGLPDRRPQRPAAHLPLPEDAGLDVPPLEGPRQPQHPLRHPDLGPPRHRPQPGRRVRHRDRRIGARPAPGDELPLRRGLRDRAQPVLRAGGHRPSADRLREGRPDARLPQHPRHGRRASPSPSRTRPTPASCASSTSSPSSSASSSSPSG